VALILVVDDDEALRSALVNTLEEERHAVVSAADGASAVSMIQQHQPDLVLCDILMAGLDGYAVLAAMR
jgi:CheY-like chemotaxis protein